MRDASLAQDVSKRTLKKYRVPDKQLHKLAVNRYPNKLKGPTTTIENHKQNQHY